MLGGFCSPVDCPVPTETTSNPASNNPAAIILTSISPVLSLCAHRQASRKDRNSRSQGCPTVEIWRRVGWPARGPASTANSQPAFTPLALVRLRVVDGELLERRIRHAQCSRFLCGAFHFPMIDHQPLDKPHRGCAAAACTVNECRLAAFGGDRLHKLVSRRGIGCGAAERDVVVANVGGFRSSGLCFQVRVWLAGLPQVDDRCETHLLDFGYRLGAGRAGASDRRLQAIEISDALNRFPRYLLRQGRGRCHPRRCYPTCRDCEMCFHDYPRPNRIRSPGSIADLNDPRGTP